MKARRFFARGGGWRGLLTGFVSGVAALAVVFAALATLVALAPWPGRDVHRPTSVAGIFHVHGEGSHDGYGTIDEAAAEAARLNARFVVVTEHNLLSPAAPERRGDVLLVPGIEISSAHGHVIAVGLQRDPEDKGPTVLESIRREGGAAILAHPVNRKRPWSDPSPHGFAGFEALSLDSAFRDALASRWGRLALGAAALVGDRRKVGGLVVGRPADALARYDEIVASRDEPLALVCGVDAHGLPPYEASFGALTLHADVGASSLAAWGHSDKADAAAVVRAIRRAATFCSVPAFGDAGAFAFHAESDEIVASVPKDDVTIVFFRDGIEVYRGQGPRLAAPRLTGAWRAEVYVDASFPYGGERLWIASSAVRIPPRPD